jgi:hypothetical protein
MEMFKKANGECFCVLISKCGRCAENDVVVQVLADDCGVVLCEVMGMMIDSTSPLLITKESEKV